MELTSNEEDILICLIENEIASDTDYLNDVEGEEKEHFKNYILELKDILTKLNPQIELVIQTL